MGSCNGKYSVKLGYHKESSGFSSLQHQSEHPLKKWWKYVWNLSIPPKIRIFSWRAAKNIIPTAHNLKMHHVPLSGLCSLCHKNFATTSHCLLLCDFARKGWKNTMFWDFLAPLRNVSFLECGLVLVEELTKTDFEVFAVLCWGVWYDTCKIIHSPNLSNRGINMDWPISMLDAFRLSSNRGNSVKTLNPLLGNIKWLAPVGFRLRLDVDAGCKVVEQLACVAAVIRNSKGELLGAKSQHSIDGNSCFS